MEDIKVLKTTEIDDNLWNEIGEGYGICFDLIKPADEFKNDFQNTISGWCLHALKFSEDGKLIGHNYLQPYPYLLNEKEIIFGLSGGTFVLPEYRKDIFIYHDLTKALFKEAKRMGWKAQGGVPNENSYKYAIKINKSLDIGKLNYFILPINISRILKNNKLRFLDVFSKPLSYLNVKINLLLSNILNFKEKQKQLRIHRSDIFLSSRFGNNKYRNFINKDVSAFYTIVNEDGIMTAYLMDFTERKVKSLRALAHTVNHIIKKEKVDAILYVGTMNLKQSLLLKTPKRFEPQEMRVVLDIIDKQDSTVKEAFSDINNMDFSLMNFDVR